MPDSPWDTTHPQGYVHPDFTPVATLLHRQLKRTRGGAAVSVYHHGECVVDLWGGNRDDQGNPWEKDTMAVSFSTSKGVCSTLLHIYADRGLIDYDMPVADYWPEFAQCGKQDITVRQVMTHQAGLYHIRQIVSDAECLLDWDYMVKALERATPVHAPGSYTAYHALTYGFIVGEIIQRVAGERFSDLLRQELAEPLDLDGLYIGTPRQELHRCARLISATKSPRLPQRMLGFAFQKYVFALSGVLHSVGVDNQISSIFDAMAPRGMQNFNFSSGDAMQAVIPAGNGVFTARSLARMYAMLAGGGELNGTRLLSEDTVRLARTPVPSPGRHAVIPLDLRWRLGYHGVYTSRGFLDKPFGHYGYGGSGAWADPDNNLSMALTVNSGSGTPMGDTRTMRLSETVQACAQNR